MAASRSIFISSTSRDERDDEDGRRVPPLTPLRPVTLVLRPVVLLGWYSEEVVPVPGEFIGAEFRRKIQPCGEDRISVSVNCVATASTWKGAPVLATSYA